MEAFALNSTDLRVQTLKNQFSDNQEPSDDNPSESNIQNSDDRISISAESENLIHPKLINDRNVEVVESQINPTEEKFAENQNLTTDMLRGMIALTSKNYAPINELSGVFSILGSNVKPDNNGKLTFMGIEIIFIKMPDDSFEVVLKGKSIKACLGGLNEIRKLLNIQISGQFDEKSGILTIGKDTYYFPTVEREEDIIKTDIDQTTNTIALSKGHVPNSFKPIHSHIGDRYKRKKDDTYRSSTAEFYCFCGQGGSIEYQSLQRTFAIIISDRWLAIAKEAIEDGDFAQKAKQTVVGVKQRKQTELDPQLQELEEEKEDLGSRLQKIQQQAAEISNQLNKAVSRKGKLIRKGVQIDTLTKKHNLDDLWEEFLSIQANLLNISQQNQDTNQPDEEQLKVKISQLKQSVEDLAKEVGKPEDDASSLKNASLHAQINQRLKAETELYPLWQKLQVFLQKTNDINHQIYLDTAKLDEANDRKNRLIEKGMQFDTTSNEEKRNNLLDELCFLNQSRLNKISQQIIQNAEQIDEQTDKNKLGEIDQQLEQINMEISSLNQSLEDLAKEIGKPEDDASMDENASLHARINQQLEMDRNQVSIHVQSLFIQIQALQTQILQLQDRAREAEKAAFGAEIDASSLHDIAQHLQNLVENVDPSLSNIQQQITSINSDNLLLDI